MKDPQYKGLKKTRKIRQTMIVKIPHGKLNMKQDEHTKNGNQLDQ